MKGRRNLSASGWWGAQRPPVEVVARAVPRLASALASTHSPEEVLRRTGSSFRAEWYSRAVVLVPRGGD